MEDLNKPYNSTNVEQEEFETMKHEIESPENFQKFMYNLFERNGIINNLRAYLRGHIVDVLKNAQTGDAIECHKHFTKRLELTYQAMNMLISEYLLRLEFNYSLSVFVSEIPLANMVFGFAKNLIDLGSDDNSSLRFKDSDVWSIINYLGIKCDSEFALRIIDMYSTQPDLPLLMCIIKCNTKYPTAEVEQEISSNESIISLNTDTDEECNECNINAKAENQCKHYLQCKSCQLNIMKIKKRYKTKKKSFVENVDVQQMNAINMDFMMAGVNVIEKSLIDEMFQQMKEVYESEVDMVREDEKKRARRFLDDHVQKLQEKCDQLELSYRNRATNLETNIREKKKFLWGLARSLRDQHAHLSRAITHLKQETDRLRLKEETLKIKISQAEELLKKRGEEMRSQISSELSILSKHLDTMRTEREAINKERNELQRSKHDHSNNDNDLKSRYNSLRDEISTLRRCIESNKPCGIEKGTITDFSDVNMNVLLNNGSDVTIKSSKVVNDFKKQKNVNFSQSTVNDLSRELTRDCIGSSSSTNIQEKTFSREVILRLQEENERLRTFSEQQRNHIDELSNDRARLRAQLVSVRFRDNLTYRPHTAPQTRNDNNVYRSTTPITPTHGYHKGSGEELSWFSHMTPSVLEPGDPVPFIGVVADRTCDSKRLLTNHWSRSSRRVSPIRSKHQNTSNACENTLEEIQQGSSSIPQSSRKLHEDVPEQRNNNGRNEQLNIVQTSPKQETSQSTEKTPKTVLREVRRLLKSNESRNSAQPSRRESPNSVLREAKLRLRKLEIEAEAVETSYLKFRRQRSEERNRVIYTEQVLENVLDLDITRSKSLQQLNSQDKLISQRKEIEESIKKDIDKFLKQYNNKADLGQTYFKNKATTSRMITPIPKAYSNNDDKCNNYLETPLNEFRKYYQYDKHVKELSKINTQEISVVASGSNKKDTEISMVDEDAKKVEIIDKPINLNNPQNSEVTEKLIDTENSLPIEIVKEIITSPNEENNLIESSDDKIVDDNYEPKSANENDKIKLDSESINDFNNVTNVNIDVIDKDDKNMYDVLVATESLPHQSEIDDNLLRVEIGSDVNIKDSNTEMVVLVSPHSEIDNNGNISPRMTIVVSPKRSLPAENNLNLDTGDQKIVDSIFKAENDVSSIDMRIELAKEIDSLSEKEYGDDFSADVDNYNSRSNFEENSPISLPKAYEDDNFWDS